MVGISQEQLYALTPRSFDNLLKGWRKKDEALMRERWEMHREVIVTLSRPHLKKAHQNKDKEKLYGLPWDKEIVKPKTIKTPENPAEFWVNIDQRVKD